MHCDIQYDLYFFPKLPLNIQLKTISGEDTPVLPPLQNRPLLPVNPSLYFVRVSILEPIITLVFSYWAVSYLRVRFLLFLINIGRGEHHFF